MRIAKVEIRKLALPMVHDFTISTGGVTHKESVLTKLFTEGGLIGYGESSTFNTPIFTGETSDDVAHVLKEVIAPNVVGKYFGSPEAFKASYDSITSSNAAKTGIECAFWHLYALQKNVSLSELFGGVQARIPVGESIGIKDTIAGTMEEVENRLAEGYRRIKLKIKPGWDVELLKAVRQQWPDIDLAVDANTAYTFNENAEILKSLDNYNLTMIEQPFAAREIMDHAKLQNMIKTPVCLDESIRSLADLKITSAVGACKLVNIKPVKVGGIIESIKIYDYAEAHDVGVWCGGMLETGIGRAFNIALASKSKFIYPADMSPYQVFFAEDLIDPSYVVDRNGFIDVPKSPGLGYAIRDDAIEKYTVSTTVI